MNVGISAASNVFPDDFGVFWDLKTTHGVKCNDLKRTNQEKQKRFVIMFLLAGSAGLSSRQLWVPVPNPGILAKS